MNKYIEIFKNFLRADQEFVEDLIPRFHHEIETIGRYLEKKSQKMYCTNNEELMELLDFIDGNGFEIIYEEPILPWDNHPYKIVPIYLEEIVENEKPKEEERPIFMDVPIQTTVLYNTSVETYEGYYSECEEYVAPRKIRFCIRGCLELPGLVPSRWCGCTRVPRPP